MSAILTGRVKWFNNTKGFGFINADGDTKDIFVHYSAIKVNGFRTLEEGQKVQFDLYQSDKGAQAQNVEVIE